MTKVSRVDKNKKNKKNKKTKKTKVSTVRHRGMETGISEASKRVSVFSFATQGGKQVSFHFRQRTGSKPERLRSGFLQADLSLIV